MTSEKKYGDTYIASVTRADSRLNSESLQTEATGVNGTEPDVGACDYLLKRR